MGFFSETLTAMLHKTDDLCAWRYFTVFAKTGSLSVASRVLQVEPSSLSRAIAGLEKSLGCELIVHGTRPLQLTDAGRSAFKRMQHILRAHDAMIESLTSEQRSLAGSIRLSSAPGFAARRLTPILQKFNEPHPEITIEILSGFKEADVKKGLCEVATLTGEPTLPDLVYMSRGRNVYLPVASPEYVQRHGMPLTPATLRSHTGYVYCGPVRPETKMLYRGDLSEPVHFATSIRSTDILAIRQALLNGMGIAVDMPLVQICEDLLAGTLIPILPGWVRPPIECYIVTNSSAWRMKRVRTFMQWYAHAMQELFASFEEKVSSIVGLPRDEFVRERDKVLYS